MGRFQCIICKGTESIKTGKHPRDMEQADIVACKSCGHVQMFPLLSREEVKKECDEDRCVRDGVAGEDGETELDRMRVKFSEWTRQHVDMYWEKMQGHRMALELASGYGFFCQECSARPDKKFSIEGVEIGAYRLANYVRGGGSA